jgi:bis(5'-nucleosyl)-tetraphosphatase (symmetrical)
MHYLVGDIQGCASALDRLLDEIAFSPSRDHLYVLGDLVNRGPGSLATLRRLRGLGAAASCVLGNHDWHLLAVAAGVRPRHRSDTLDDILDAPDREDWLAWVRTRRMAVFEQGWLMLHAGVVPQWDLATTLQLAAELEQNLRERPPREFWPPCSATSRALSDSLAGDERLRFTLNTLTRIRFVADDGTLEFQTKDGADAAPPGFRPWFDVPGRRTAGVPIAFGHWSSLGLVERDDLLGLDTGCVWGGKLTAVRLDARARNGLPGLNRIHAAPCAPSPEVALAVRPRQCPEA